MFEYREDVDEQGRPLDPDKALSDAALAAGGLVPVRSWLRTRASKNALRVRKHKEKLAARGVRQVNLQAAEADHAALKALAQASREGRDWRTEVLSGEAAAVVRVLEGGGWRAKLIRWLAKAR